MIVSERSDTRASRTRTERSRVDISGFRPSPRSYVLSVDIDPPTSQQVPENVIGVWLCLTDTSADPSDLQIPAEFALSRTQQGGNVDDLVICTCVLIHMCNSYLHVTLTFFHHLKKDRREIKIFPARVKCAPKVCTGLHTPNFPSPHVPIGRPCDDAD